MKLQNFSILQYYSSICATHIRLLYSELFKTAFYSLSIKNLCLSYLRLRKAWKTRVFSATL